MACGEQEVTGSISNVNFRFIVPVPLMAMKIAAGDLCFALLCVVGGRACFVCKHIYGQ